MTEPLNNNNHSELKTQDDDAALESALNSLVKAFKSLNLYPADHPQLDEAVSAAFRQIKPLLQERELKLLWSRDSCTIADRAALKSSSSTAKFLAREMLTRKLQKLILLQELTKRDLKIFLSLIATDPAIIHEKGGIEAVMIRAGIITIGANEVDLDLLKNRQQQKESEPEEVDAQSEDEDDASSANSASDAPVMEDPAGINALLARLAAEVDEQTYMQLVRAIIDAAEKLKRREFFTPLLVALKTLLDELSSPSRSASQKEYTRFALEQITGGVMTTFLLDRIEQRATGQEDLLDRLCEAIGKTLAYPLIQRLCVAETLHIRKAIAKSLAKTGTGGIPAITSMLRDERWYVVRNIVTILGEIAAPELLNALQTVAKHPEPKVRKEVIKSLLKINPQAADTALIGLLVDPDKDVVRQAVHALGAIRCKSAVSPLIDILTLSDSFLKEHSLKKQVIMSLGRIGDKQATSVLMEILTSRRWLAPGRWQEIKIVAAAALGQLGDESAIPLLKRLTDNDTPLGIACSDAADNLERLAK